MNTLVIVVSILQIIVALVLIATILLQSGRQAGLSGAIAGASETFFGKNKGRSMDSMLSKLTAGCAILFLCTSLFLAYGSTLTNKTNPDAATQQSQTQPEVTFEVPAAPSPSAQ